MSSRGFILVACLVLGVLSACNPSTGTSGHGDTNGGAGDPDPTGGDSQRGDSYRGDPTPGDSEPLGGDTSSPMVEAACDAWYGAQADCAGFDATQRELAVAECVNTIATIASHWRQPFADAFAACAAGVDCAMITNIDDLCFPEALAAVVDGLIDPSVLETCQISADCEALAASPAFTAPGVVADCLRRWVACAPERQDHQPYWTEDYCLTLLAIADGDRTAAASCLPLSCGDVVPCLQALGAFNF